MFECCSYQLQQELALTEQHPSESRRKRWRELNEILANKRAKKSADKESSVYPSIAWADVKEVFQPFTKYCQETLPLPDDLINLLYKYTSLAVNCLGVISTGKEAKRLHFIAPVLILVCCKLDNVEILVEEDMDGKNVQVNGRFEFIIQRGGKRVCIVEAKKDDIEQGMAQDLLGCEAVADIERLNCVYGIVTNYKEWIFLRSLNNRIELEEATITFDDNMPTRKSLARIAGKINAMLSGELDEE
ncbi:3106_t:CDS:2 [Paraglomus occultum]|uniref:3106_t:CDS:1 n=1 Tax=Paraglomus occultum TaxID=144539 RepID=A0A9N9D3I0_9GLOM|nr:3106_t:CDS:2 [Paraglomus occultum]